MATRPTRLSASHVDALNAIPIEFYGSSKELQAIQDAWRIYLNHMSAAHLSPDVWDAEWSRLFFDLLLLISKYLGYKFNRVEIEKEIYSPKIHAAIESEQDIIRRGLAQMFSGKLSIPLDVKGFPVSEEAITEQEAIRKALLKWLNGDAFVGVELNKS